MLIDLLRSETRLLHQRLEQSLDLTTGHLGIDRYKRVLLQFRGFYSPVEHLVSAYSDDAQMWIGGDRRKTHLIDADLDWLGCEDELRLSVAAAGSGLILPDLSTRARQIGFMYVIEGSTLGGQFMLPHLKRQLDVSPGKGASFFGSYGENVGKMWRVFRERMEAEGATPDAGREIISAARDAFETLDRWFRSPYGMALASDGAVTSPVL